MCEKLPIPKAKLRGAFTLLELMVVVVLLGIMTAAILPEMRGTSEEALLRSSSRELVNVFTVAYSRAVNLNQVHRVHLDKLSSRYVLEGRTRGGESANGFEPVRDVPGSEGAIDKRILFEIRSPEQEMLEGQNAAPEPELEPAAWERRETIAFYPDGTADGREVLLTDRAGFRLALRISPITARVQIIEMGREQ